MDTRFGHILFPIRRNVGRYGIIFFWNDLIFRLHSSRFVSFFFFAQADNSTTTRKQNKYQGKISIVLLDRTGLIAFIWTSCLYMFFPDQSMKFSVLSRKLSSMHVICCRGINSGPWFIELAFIYYRKWMHNLFIKLFCLFHFSFILFTL